MICLNIHNVFSLIFFVFFFFYGFNARDCLFNTLTFSMAFVSMFPLLRLVFITFFFQLPCMFVSVVDCCACACMCWNFTWFRFWKRADNFSKSQNCNEKKLISFNQKAHISNLSRRKKRSGKKIANEYDESKQNMFPVMTNTAHIAWCTNICALWQKWRILLSEYFETRAVVNESNNQVYTVISLIFVFLVVFFFCCANKLQFRNSNGHFLSCTHKSMWTCSQIG